MEKKPSVIPNQKQISDAQDEKSKIIAYENEKKEVVNQIYSSVIVDSNDEAVSYDYLNQNNSVDEMRKRTADQLARRASHGSVIEPELAEVTTRRVYDDSNRNKNEEQMRVRDEQLAKNKLQTQNYQRLSEEASNRHINVSVEKPMETTNNNNGYVPPKPPTTTTYNTSEGYGENPSNIDSYIMELSQPNYNSPFDVIPLPSQGKTYRNKKENVKVSYMTTADENILTSPNLLESGEFLNILINRKILEPELRYKNLLVGDRNAIMIWLRATGYGEMYPVTLLDEEGEPFDTEINLNDLKTKNLGAEPDNEGLFNYKLPLSKVDIKFRLLTCGDIDDIESMVERDKLNGIPVNNTTTYNFQKMIVEVNGDRDRNTVREFINSLRIKDGKDFNEYVESIQCGIDLNITVGTPGGGSVNTFLPLNVSFFWPNFRL